MLHNKYMRQSLVKKSLIFGEPDYFNNIRSKIIPFITSRVVPFAGFTLITVMIARLNYPELGTFTYLTAMFSLPVVLMSMPLAMVGNFSAESKKTGESGSEIFLSGLPLAILLSVSGGLIAAIMLFYFVSPVDKNVNLAGEIYCICVPFLIINTYLFYYIESYISNKIMAKVKIASTFISAVAIVSLSVVVDKIVTWHVFSVFLLIEIILFCLYSWVIASHSDGNLKQGLCSKVTEASKKLIVIGLPVALGLTGQKAVYFLITQRINDINSSLVADLSVMMSISGILSLPFAALAQIHSLFVSESDFKFHYQIFKQGIICGCIAIFSILIIGTGGYYFLLKLYNAAPVLYNLNYFLSISSLFVASSLMLLSMSHLRALHDTLYPQSIAVLILLVGFIPVIWLHTFKDDALYKIIYIQAAFTMLIFVVLSFRIKTQFKLSNGTEVTQ